VEAFQSRKRWGGIILMRVFAVSDLHVDYEPNGQWAKNLSCQDYKDDILILAGDLSDLLGQIGENLNALVMRFKKVLYVPGNHEMWIIRSPEFRNSIAKFLEVCRVVRQSGASMECLCTDALTIVPLLGWYDYSFGEPCDELRAAWMDFRACRWPSQMNERQAASFFATMNEPLPERRSTTVISFSHFLPRIDLIPDYIPHQYRYLYPVMGADILERQIRHLGASIHVYGHSHVNHRIALGGVTYVNNAFGYPSEVRTTAKRLLCIYEDGKPA
jgi:predicted phosphodiesterase